MSSVRSSLVAVAALAVAPSPVLAAKPSAAFSIVVTDVVAKDPKSADQVAIVEALRAASNEEAHYYDPALTPVTLRIRISKVSYKSAGKAIASSLPFVGLVAGSNRNALKGDVELVERGSGKSLRHFKIEADDDTFFSAGDTALSLGKTGLSFLPFGMLIGSAVDVAQGAAYDRAASQKMLTRGFVMLSYRKAFGDTTYRRFSAQRKAAHVASQKADTVTQSLVPPATLTAAAAIN